MITYFELLAVLFIAVIPSFLYFFMPEQFRKRRRASTYSLLWSVLRYIGTIFFILYIALHQETGMLSIGIDPNRFDLILAGVVLISFFILIYAFVKKVLFRVKETTYEKDFENEILSHKSLQKQILLLIMVSLAAISEELVFRGYFILIWGQRTGYPIICAIISSIVFIALHLHRGKKAIPYYTAVTICLVIPTLYANTILVSIGMHLYLNVAVTLGIWIRDKKRQKKVCGETFAPTPKSTFVPPKPVPYSKTAIILFICSWIAIPFSLFLYGIPSAIIIGLAIFNIIRLKKKKEKKVGIGFCIGTVAVSMLPILAIAAFFGLFYFLEYVNF